MMFAAVRMDCFHPSATRVYTTSDRGVLKLGSDWLVYQVRAGQDGILLPYNDETEQRELPKKPRT